MQSKPAKKHWIDLAKQSGETGREDCQAGWHTLAATIFKDRTVLDVGSGLCLVKTRIPWCITQDPAPALDADIRKYISELPADSFDAVTCFDVIEHVMEDLDFLENLYRIAKKFIFITTPNELVSKAVNGCHCREYTPEEFIELACGLQCGKVSYWAGDGRGLKPVSMTQDDFLKHTEPHQAVLLLK